MAVQKPEQQQINPATAARSSVQKELPRTEDNHNSQTHEATSTDNALRQPTGSPYYCDLYIKAILKAVSEDRFQFDIGEQSEEQLAAMFAEVQIPEQAITSATIIEKLRQITKAKKQEKSKSRQSQEQYEHNTPQSGPA